MMYKDHPQLKFRALVSPGVVMPLGIQVSIQYIAILPSKGYTLTLLILGCANS